MSSELAGRAAIFATNLPNNARGHSLAKESESHHVQYQRGVSSRRRAEVSSGMNDIDNVMVDLIKSMH